MDFKQLTIQGIHFNISTDIFDQLYFADGPYKNCKGVTENDDTIGFSIDIVNVASDEELKDVVFTIPKDNEYYYVEVINIVNEDFSLDEMKKFKARRKNAFWLGC